MNDADDADDSGIHLVVHGVWKTWQQDPAELPVNDRVAKRRLLDRLDRALHSRKEAFRSPR